MERLRDTVEKARSLTASFEEAARRLRQIKDYPEELDFNTEEGPSEPPFQAPNVVPYVPKGAKVKARHVHFEPDQPLSYVVIYNNAVAGVGIMSGVMVFHFDRKGGKWVQVLHRQLEEPLLAPLAFLAQERMRGFGGGEQVVIGAWEGSGSNLKFLLLGSSNRTIRVLLDRMQDPLFQGSVRMEPQGDLLAASGTQGMRYRWTGAGWQTSRFLEQPDLKQVQPGDIVLRYTIDEQNNVVTNPPQDQTLRLELGRSIFLVRENYGPVERILYDGEIFESVHGGGRDVVRAVKSGEGYINIIPSGYEWEKAARLSVNVAPAPARARALGNLQVLGSPLYGEQRESVRLTGREPKESVVVYHTPGEVPGKAGVIVLQYDEQERQWKQVFEQQVTNLPLRILAVGPFLGSELEQVVIGAILDAGRTLHVLVLGSRDGKPAVLLNRIDDPVPLQVKE